MVSVPPHPCRDDNTPPRQIHLEVSRPLRRRGCRQPENQLRTNLHGTLVSARPIRCVVDGGEFWASSAALPLRDASCALIECRNLIEFVRDDEAAGGEFARVLRSGGKLRLRVPNQGPLAGLDGYNLYRYLVDITHRGRKPPETSEVGWRRHYSIDDLASLLGTRFCIRSITTRRLAFAELLHFAAMVVFRWLTRSDEGYRRARSLIRAVERLEDKITLGQSGFVLEVEAIRLLEARECASQAIAAERPEPQYPELPMEQSKREPAVTRSPRP